MSIINKSISNADITLMRSDLIKSKKLFIDESFPLKAHKSQIKLLRPHEISPNPQFIVEGVSRFDANQGSLGNCWFMAAIDNLTQHKQLFDRVVCDSNDIFDDHNYCGLFHFRFWHFGAWINIIIDDRLPTTDKNLVFVRSKSPNEFWPSLLEKAYAKLHGGYEKLIGGQINDGFSNLTGGVTETYDLKNPPVNFYNMILKAFKRNILMGCAKFRDTGDIGIPKNHAYSVSSVNRVINVYGNVVDLIRIRNPWGNYYEYTGPYSDTSDKWLNVPQHEKQRINFNNKSDGEFWMTFDDFLYHFDFLDICNLTPDTLTKEPCSGREWKVATYQHAWHKDIKNKHEFQAVDPDPYDNENYCTVVFAIMYLSKNRKDVKQLGLKITSEHDKKFQKITKPDNLCRREKVFRFDIQPGKYKIEILSFDTQDSFEYLFRIFHETKRMDSLYPSLFMENSMNHLKKSKKDKNVKPLKYYAQKKVAEKNLCSLM